MKRLSHCCALFGSLMLCSCYAEPKLDYTKICADESPACLAQDSDGDGVKNGEDDFPFDERCSRLSNEDCQGCGVGCESPLVCLVMERTCVVGADQGLVDQGLDQCIANGEDDSCDGLDNDCDSRVDEGCMPCYGSPNGCPNFNFMRIESGSFMMGSIEGESNEVPVHSVTVKRFEMTTTEVTVAQYRACVDAGWCSEPSTGSYCNWETEGRDHYPINCVDWGQARTFAKWIGSDVDLPTEAEWEYAAKGGEGFVYAGSNHASEVAWYSSNSGGVTQPVGSKESNGYGLYDMSGNVWEWVLDEYHSNYQGAPVVSDDAWGNVPECSQVCGINSTGRVIRGGSWNFGVTNLRVASRYVNSSDLGGSFLGFRVRRTIP